MPHALESMLDKRDRLFKFARKLAGIAFLQVERNDFGIELQDNQVMADLVVKVLGEAPPFLLVGFPKLNRELLGPPLSLADALAKLVPLRHGVLRIAGQQTELIQRSPSGEGLYPFRVRFGREKERKTALQVEADGQS